MLVLGAGKNAIRLAPPLVLTKAQADSVLAVLDQALTEVSRLMRIGQVPLPLPLRLGFVPERSALRR